MITVRASEVKKGMVIKVGLPGREVDLYVSFSRKHRRYSGHMMIQGTSKEHGFAELGPRCNETFQRIK